MTGYLILLLIITLLAKSTDKLVAVSLVLVQIADYHFGSWLFSCDTTNGFSIAFTNLLCLIIVCGIHNIWKRSFIIVLYTIGVILNINEAITPVQSLFYNYLNYYQTFLCEGVLAILLWNKKNVKTLTAC